MCDKIICPVCEKDLTEALKLLGADFSFHMERHLDEMIMGIFVYLSLHMDELPEELRKMCEERSKNIEQLVIYNQAVSEE